MATYHYSIKNGKKGKAKEHASYITREGKHGKNNKKEDLIATEHGNLPEWANNNPHFFWKMADQHERQNGAAYQEFEVALPLELTETQNIDLVRDFIKQEIGEKTYQVAIHVPTAALGEVKQPHAHAIFSNRIPDGIKRSPERHFKRFNSIHPELGGCKKDCCGKEPEAWEDETKSRRKRWADLQNKHLEMHGHSARVDHRSHRDRGIEKEAEKHLGAAAIKKMTEEDKTLFKDKRQSNNKTK